MRDSGAAIRALSRAVTEKLHTVRNMESTIESYQRQVDKAKDEIKDLQDAIAALEGKK